MNMETSAKRGSALFVSSPKKGTEAKGADAKETIMTMTTGRKFLIGLAMVLASVVTNSVANAAPDVSGCGTIDEPNGFTGVCGQPCFSVSKCFEVWFPNNPGNPLPLAGNNTYIYKLTHLGGSGPFVPGLVAFELSVDTSFVTGAGFIDTPAACTGVAVPHSCCTGPGTGPTCSTTAIAPSATTTGVGQLTWDFLAPIISAGETSELLYVHSPLLPGTVNDNMVSIDAQLGLDAPGSSVGPLILPNGEAPGEPLACTIGWWKNRADRKQGTLQFFPDPDFTAVVTQAVSLSGGVFATNAALLADLTSKGARSIDVRGRQQLAALLLSLAGGDLFPGNQKCKLFEGNHITANQCGTNITIGDALTQIIADLLSGDPVLQHNAQQCADDINNGIGVVM